MSTNYQMTLSEIKIGENLMKEKVTQKSAIPFKDKLAWASCDGMGTLLAWNLNVS